jgi:hypothetical protein
MSIKHLKETGVGLSIGDVRFRLIGCLALRTTDSCFSIKFDSDSTFYESPCREIANTEVKKLPRLKGDVRENHRWRTSNIKLFMSKARRLHRRIVLSCRVISHIFLLLNTFVYFSMAPDYLMHFQRHIRSQGVHVNPRVANVQVSTECCSSLTDKTFNTQKPPHSQIWVRKNYESTKLVPFYNYNPSSERSKQASKRKGRDFGARCTPHRKSWLCLCPAVGLGFCL